jgi:cytochrome c biogenesis protein CcmG, thiol:disulfide interchange protein DsbE
MTLRGRVVVLNFWGSWCAPCRDEAPYLQALSDEYGDRGVVVLGISYLDTVTGARGFIDEFNLTYLNAPDQEARIANAYAVQGAPETFVIDREGNIALFILGAVDLPENEPRLRATLETLLGG